MAETGAAVTVKPLPQPELEAREPEAPGAPARARSWFGSGVPAPERRSAWKDVLKTGMK